MHKKCYRIKKVQNLLNSLKIFYFKGYDDSDDSWVDYQDIYNNEILKQFVDQTHQAHDLVIRNIVENAKQQIKKKLRVTLRTKTAAEISLFDIYPFEYYEYHVVKAACYHLKINNNIPDNMQEHLQTLIYKAYLYDLEQKMFEKHEAIVQQIKRVQDANIEIENFVDFEALPGKNLVDHF